MLLSSALRDDELCPSLAKCPVMPRQSMCYHRIAARLKYNGIHLVVRG